LHAWVAGDGGEGGHQLISRIATLLFPFAEGSAERSADWTTIAGVEDQILSNCVLVPTYLDRKAFSHCVCNNAPGRWLEPSSRATSNVDSAFHTFFGLLRSPALLEKYSALKGGCGELPQDAAVLHVASLILTAVLDTTSFLMFDVQEEDVTAVFERMAYWNAMWNPGAAAIGEADLIRNLLLSYFANDRERVVRIYREYWIPVEERADLLACDAESENDTKTKLPRSGSCTLGIPGALTKLHIMLAAFARSTSDGSCAEPDEQLGSSGTAPHLKASTLFENLRGYPAFRAIIEESLTKAGFEIHVQVHSKEAQDVVEGVIQRMAEFSATFSYEVHASQSGCLLGNRRSSICKPSASVIEGIAEGDEEEEESEE